MIAHYAAGFNSAFLCLHHLILFSRIMLQGSVVSSVKALNPVSMVRDRPIIRAIDPIHPNASGRKAYCE